jgi:hypothetical protein
MMRGAFLLATAIVLGVTALSPADPPKVEQRSDHWMPLLVEITEKDPKRKPAKVMLVRVMRGNGYVPHVIRLTDGEKQVSVSLDTIREIKDIDDKRLTIVFKSGAKREFAYDEEESLSYYDEDTDATGSVPLGKVKSVRFLTVPRKDREGNAMFDHWRYSPFTGEELPKIEAR